MADASGRLDLDAITRPWPHVDRQIDDLRAENERLRDGIRTAADDLGGNYEHPVAERLRALLDDREETT